MDCWPTLVAADYKWAARNKWKPTM